MFKKTMTGMVLAATAITGFTAVPAEARHYRNNGYYNNGYSQPYNRGYDYRRDDYRYDNRYRNTRCKSGTTGTIIGAAAGGLIGNEVARRGDKSEGAIIGALLGGIAGRVVEKSGNARYC